MKISEIIKIADEICPPELAEEWDNCGWQINCGDAEVSSVMTALEITWDVIEEAAAKGANLIITHHPLIFQGLKSININTVTGKYILRLLAEKISVYACHTDFDKAEGGNNDYLGEVLGLSDICCLSDGYVRTGELREEMTAAGFGSMLAEKLGVPRAAVRICADPEKSVKKIGWCTGAGADFVKSAAEAGCDAFVTGDVKYHEAREASEAGGIAVIDAGHFGTEAGFGRNMADKLCERTQGEIRIFPSESISDAFFYL